MPTITKWIVSSSCSSGNPEIISGGNYPQPSDSYPMHSSTLSSEIVDKQTVYLIVVLSVHQMPQSPQHPQPPIGTLSSKSVLESGWIPPDP